MLTAGTSRRPPPSITLFRAVGYLAKLSLRACFLIIGDQTSLMTPIHDLYRYLTRIFAFLQKKTELAKTLEFGVPVHRIIKYRLVQTFHNFIHK